MNFNTVTTTPVIARRTCSQVSTSDFKNHTELLHLAQWVHHLQVHKAGHCSARSSAADICSERMTSNVQLRKPPTTLRSSPMSHPRMGTSRMVSSTLIVLSCDRQCQVKLIC